MKMNEKQSRHLDIVLMHLISIKGATDLKAINKEFFPDESYDYCLSLFSILKEYYPQLLYPEGEIEDDCFWARDYARVFLNDGGFSRDFDSKKEEIIKRHEKEELEIQKLKYDVKNTKRVYKTYWFTFTFAVIALLVSLYNLIIGLFK
jgi:hypothetical protein